MTRSEPTITVTCDNTDCGDEIQVELTALARRSYDERHVDSYLQSRGWGRPNDDDTLDLCPDCMRDMDDDEDD